MKRAREVRGFTDTAYFQGAAGNMPGAVDGFTISLMLRCLGPSVVAMEHIFGNYNETTQQGWRFRRAADFGGFGAQYGIELWAGGVLSTASTVDFPGALLASKFTPVHARFTPGSIILYLFGFTLGGDAVPAAYTPCLETPSIGYSVNDANFPAPHTAIVGCSYTPRALTDLEIANNNLEMIKRCDVTSAGLDTPWQYEYSFLQSCGVGVCQTLPNRQDALTPMEAVGRSQLINGAPRAVIGF